MNKAEDYKRHAEECRTMARNTNSEEQRQGLIQMAAVWEGLATDHLAQIERQKRIAALDQPNGAK